MGALVAPTLHQIQHGVEYLFKAHTDEGSVSVYESVELNALKIVDAELSCALCSFTLVGATDNSLHSSDTDTYVIIPQGGVDLTFVQGLISSIRGPPAFS